MKTRQGFVSNSSTSSFICVKCGDIEAGFEIGASDVHMIYCEKGHVLHHGCIDGWDEHENEMKNDDSELKSDCCPVCKMVFIENDNIMAYCLKKLGLSREDISIEMQKKFKTYDEMIKGCST